MEQTSPLQLLDAQQEIIHLILSDKPLPFTLNRICELIENALSTEQAFASVLMVKDNQLMHSAAPSLPKKYCMQVDGTEIGPNVGSCGTAIYRQQRIIVEDIAKDPLWENYKELALSNNLKACWSTPIISVNNEVLGSFAVYYSEPLKPTETHLSLIDRFVNLAGMAIEQSDKNSERAHLITKVQQANERFNAITAVLPDIAFIVDNEGTCCEIYGSDSELLYKTKENVLGKNIFEILPEDLSSVVLNTVQKTIDTDTTQILEYELDVPKGIRIFEGRTALIKSYDHKITDKQYILWMARDITDRKTAENEVQKLAYYDQLTQLPNRRLLIDELKKLIQQSQDNDKIFIVLYIDLDNFKRFNDSLGHSEGDSLLTSFKNRILPLVGSSNFFARVGGDEFVIILENLKKDFQEAANEATIISQKVIRALKNPVRSTFSEYQLSASIGISIIDDSISTADDALKYADSAMYSSKKRGGNTYTLYDPSLQASIDDRLKIEKDILISLDKGDFCAFFQPQINHSGEVTGAEALIRWNHPEKGLITPIHFIPIAEQFGLTQNLSQVVMHDVYQMLNTLIDRKLVNDEFNISANVSAVDFKNPHILQTLTESSREFKIPCSRVKLELTESMLVHDIKDTVKQMHYLKNLGFKISIDDFGTGYSSLNYLHEFPIDELKIDKSFVHKMMSSNSVTAIIDAIVNLCFNLGIKVIAEGIEEHTQLEALRQRYIYAMQGYYFAKPMPAEEFLRWMEEKKELKLVENQ
ncbi:bifunctional diguanylate cyclase/phosphodiesterase [Pleionea sediminis]|uniref:bifunctional diguanylate cyclase/phosphodiesterase n=1 Tax=Pleionea sediminis TaxID=2569479 RepID=UPI001186FEE7|nr:EAL domain-containing protein [Pleionea sediminis]